MRLQITDMDVRYDDATVLHNINFTVGNGETVAVLGPNGAGKSTLLRSIAGIVGHTGRVALEHEDAEAPPEDSRAIAYMPQEGLSRTGLSVLEAVILGRHESLGWQVSQEDLVEAQAILEQLGMESLAHRDLNTLSGGQRQLAGLAQALFRRPRLLLLDEPTSALDLHRQMRVLDGLKALAAKTGISILTVLHDLSLAARFASRILFLKDGCLVADNASDLVLTGEIIGKVYDIEAEILRSRSGQLHVMPVRPLELTSNVSLA